VSASLPSGLMAMMRRGDLLARLGRYEEALANYESVALSRKADGMSIPKLLQIRRMLARFDLPKALREVLDGSEDVNARACYAEFLLDAGQASAAHEVIRSLEGAPGGAEVLKARARAKMLAGDAKGAAEILSAARGEDGVPVELEGEYREQCGDLFGAAAVYRRALEKDPDDMSAAVGLARVLSRLGQHKEAVEAADYALGIDDRDWEPHLIKAEAFRAAGDGRRQQQELAHASAMLRLAGMTLDSVLPRRASHD